jgi:hypothetical protein
VGSRLTTTGSMPASGDATAPDRSFGGQEVPKTGVRKACTHPLPVRLADVIVLGDGGTPPAPI